MTDPTQFSTNELAARWGLKPAALRHHRSKGTGPVYQRLSRNFLPLGSPYVIYFLEDVLDFEAAHNITPLN
jgi:hypothetical protein